MIQTKQKNGSQGKHCSKQNGMKTALVAAQLDLWGYGVMAQLLQLVMVALPSRRLGHIQGEPNN